jgi:hypothetical protein
MYFSTIYYIINIDSLRLLFNFTARQPAYLRDIYRMYASMTHGSSMRDLCQRLNPQNLRINERKLIQFGLIEGLIRRVYKVSEIKNLIIKINVFIIYLSIIMSYGCTLYIENEMYKRAGTKSFILLILYFKELKLPNKSQYRLECIAKMYIKVIKKSCK